MSFVVPSLPLDEAGPVFAVLLLVMLAAPLVARVVRLPDVVVLILAGVVVGPAGLHLLERDGAIALLGSAGLLYLMFLAGLELDMDDFRSTRVASLVFGALTFIVPLTVGTAAALAIGLPLLPAVLLGSCWSSHTLLVYPQFRRAGTSGHRAVAATVGATIVTDTAALLVLVVVVRAHEGALTASFWATLVPAFALLVVATMWGLPRLARAFFAGPGQDGTLRLVFVLACLFVVSTLTAVVGVEPIIGAFLAGLALNRSVPGGGALMGRVDMLGSTLFVPLFLLATGMLVDVRLLADPAVLGSAALFSAVAMGSKGIAAAVAARTMRVGRTAGLAMFSLSNAQAAATLAAVVVGLEVGLLEAGTVNAVIVVILVTCVVSSLVAARVATRLPVSGRSRPLGSVVVVPVVNPASAAPLLSLASSLAQADAGLIVPLVIAPTGSDEQTVAERRALLEELTTIAQSAGAEAQPVLRIDTAPAVAIGATVAEREGSALVLGWQGASAAHGSRFGGAVDLVLDAVPTPTLLVHEGPRRVTRVLVVLDHRLITDAARNPLLLGLRAASVLARERRVRLEVVSTVADDALRAVVQETAGVEVQTHGGSRASLLTSVAAVGDLVVLPVLQEPLRLRTFVSRTLRAVPQGASTVVAVAAPARVEPGPTDDGTSTVAEPRAGSTPHAAR